MKLKLQQYCRLFVLFYFLCGFRICGCVGLQVAVECDFACGFKDRMNWNFNLIMKM